MVRVSLEQVLSSDISSIWMMGPITSSQSVSTGWDRSNPYTPQTPEAKLHFEFKY